MTVAATDGCFPPGAAPVGRVLDLSPFEMQLVIYLRLWCGGARGQTEVWQDLEARLGAQDGRAALLAFERFFREFIASAPPAGRCSATASNAPASAATRPPSLGSWRSRPPASARRQC